MTCDFPKFSAALIAACLGRSPQAIRKSLRDAKPDGLCIVGGKQTATWLLESLPTQLRCSLDAEALRRRYRDAVTMLAMPPKRWEPTVPMSQVAQREIDRANKLREALLPSLTRQHDSEISSAEFEADGATDYAKCFGHVITARHWRSLYRRTIQRDGGAENWSRLEIYLPDKPALNTPLVRPLPATFEDQFQELTAFIEACRNPVAPSDTEQLAIWTLAFEQHDRFISQGISSKQARRRLRDFLFTKASFLAPTRNALRMAFDRKLATWTVSNRDAKALRDGREENGARFELPDRGPRFVDSSRRVPLSRRRSAGLARFAALWILAGSH